MRAKADEKERIRQEQWAERQARLQRAVERSGNLVTETEERVRELLLDGDFNEVADYLLVTVSTLTRWTHEPCRAEWWAQLCHHRGVVDGFAVKTTGMDNTLDPQHKALTMKGQTWGAQTFARTTFGPRTQVDHNVSVDIAAVLDAAANRAKALRQDLLPALPSVASEDGGRWDDEPA